MWLLLTPYLRSRDTTHAQYDFWPKHVLKNAFSRWNKLNNSKHLIFGTLLNIGKPEQQKDKFSLKGCGLGHKTLVKFGIPPLPSDIFPKHVKLQI